MFEFWKKYLLSTAVSYAPPGDPPAGGGDGDEQIPEPNLDEDPAGDGEGDPEGEGEDEGDGDEDGDEDPDDAGGDPPAQQTRGNRQVGELRRVSRERAEENARLTREIAEMRGRLDQLGRAPAQPVESAAQRAERMALMSPEERAMELVNESLNRHNQQQQQLTNQLLDNSDRSTYEARAAANPLLRRLSPEVERTRQQIMQRDGQVISRMDVATYLIGQKVLAQQGKGKPAAAGRRRQQQVQPTAPRGDIQSPRRDRRAGRTGDAVQDFESRFGDTPI